MGFGIGRRDDCDCDIDFIGKSVETTIALIVIILMIVLLIF